MEEQKVNKIVIMSVRLNSNNIDEESNINLFEFCLNGSGIVEYMYTHDLIEYIRSIPDVDVRCGGHFGPIVTIVEANPPYLTTEPNETPEDNLTTLINLPNRYMESPYS